MTTRLDRLLLLLSTGSTPLVRQTAARQLGSIAAQRIARGQLHSFKTAEKPLGPSYEASTSTANYYHGLDGEWGEVVQLIVKVLPYLRSKSWETRTAAALAIECIVREVGIWHPPDLSLDVIDILQDVEPAESILNTFNLKQLLLEGQKLLASSGTEYVGGERAANGQASKDLVKSLGLSMPGAGDQDLGIDVEKELQDGDNQQRQYNTGVKGKGRAMAVTQQSVPASASQSPQADGVDIDVSNLSARERNALKRKRKAAGTISPAASSPAPPPPPNKKRLAEQTSHGTVTPSRSVSPASAITPNIKKEDDNDSTLSEHPDRVTIAYRGPKESQKVDPDVEDSVQPSWVPTAENWPFSTIVEALRQDLLSPSWETRHGAALGLREILKVQGRAGGTVADKLPKENEFLHRLWSEDIAFSLLTVFALDRFGDFVGDHVVAPVRETSSQTLSALLLYVPTTTIVTIHSILLQMVKQDTIFTDADKAILKAQGRKAHFWEVKHSGLSGLKYVVAVRKDLYTARRPATELVKQEEKGGNDIQVGTGESTERNYLKEVLVAATLGLRDSDDDVRGVAASALLPITSNIVEELSDQELFGLLDVICICLGDLKDDLSSSVGNVMDLLANLIQWPRVLDHLQDNSHGDRRSLVDLIPRLFPFFRHTISSVRLAVISALNIFLSIPSKEEQTAHQAWIDDRLLRLVFQNLIVEEKDNIRQASQAAWTTLIRLLTSTPAMLPRLQALTRPHLSAWFDILMMPIGQEVNESLFWKHSEPQAGGGSVGAYNVDKAVLKQDLALISVEQTLKGRLSAATALSLLLSQWPVLDQERDLGHLLPTYMISASSHQLAFTCIILEEWARMSGPASLTSVSPLVSRIAPLLIKALESDPAVAYSETSALLSQIHAHCQQLFGIFKNKAKVPSGRIPTLSTALDFSLDRARQAVTSDFAALNSIIKEKARAGAQPLLEDLRIKIETEVNRVSLIKEAMDIQVYASLAGAAITLQVFPAKLNPLIRSIMNGIKFEVNLDLQQRSTKSIAFFIQLCTQEASPVKTNPSDKIIKNLATFLCQDTSITPLFKDHSGDKGILNLPEAPGENRAATGRGSSKTATAHGVKIDSTENEAVIKARLVRRGAEMSIASLADLFQEKLFERIPRLWACMSDALFHGLQEKDVAIFDERCRQSGGTIGQDTLDCLTVLSAVIPKVVEDLHPRICQVLPMLVLAIQSDFAVVRHVAARSFAILCDTMPEEGMKSVVLDVVPFMADPLSAARRKGAVELISCLVTKMETRILPYIIFLVVPILGRMTDADDEVRVLATSTFATLVKLVPLEAGLPDPPGFSADLLAKRDTERDFLTQLLDGSKVADYEMPVKVTVNLRKYQQEGVNWLAFLAKYQLHGILCDDMGLGKTLQSICILASKTAERARRYTDTQSPDAVHLPSLVVCPPTLTGHWQHEIKTYVSNLTCIIYGGDRSSRSARLEEVPSLSKYDVVITSYDVVRNDIDTLSHVDWNYCILDEGHIIKNGKTKLSQAIKRLRAIHRLILSGTPIQNNVLELWSLFDFLMPGFLGTEESFNRRFGKPIQASRDAKSSSKEQEAGALALEALHKQVLPFLLRRLKEDVLDDLPPKIIQDYYCELSPLQRDLYENFSKSQAEGNEMDAYKTSSTDSAAKETHVFQTLQYLRKLVNHPSLVIKPDNSDHQKILARHGLLDLGQAGLSTLEQAPKLLALKQLLLDNGIGVGASNGSVADLSEPAVAPHRVLIFCQLKPMLDLIENTLFAKYLPSVTYMRLDGTTPSHKRHAVVQTFNSDPSIDVLLLTTHVGGLGLNLTGADTVIFVEHDWNPMKDLQAMDRAHRLGQKRVVNVYRLITRGTLEEKIMGLQRFKLNIASSVVTQQNADLSTMETENVLDLFSLGSQDDLKKQQKNARDGPISQKALLEGLHELDEADEDYKDLNGNVGEFAASLKQ